MTELKVTATAPTPYQFSHDWFDRSIPYWQQIASEIPNKKCFLEIGSYEGRSTVWTVENLLANGGDIHCIDTWEGGEEHAALGGMGGVENRFDNNIAKLLTKYPDRDVFKHKGKSFDILARMNARPDPYEFDFIYVDGSHVAKDVLADACLAFNMLRVGGVMIFDDYLWGEQRDILHRPKMAIDAFLDINAEYLGVMALGYQVIVKRIK